jgi:carbonic anhydrase
VTPDADWFEIGGIHYPDCGSALMADLALRAGFVTRRFDDDVLRRAAVVDLANTVPVDMQSIIDATRASASGRIRVSGYAYDTRTGLLEQIVAPRSRDGR